MCRQAINPITAGVSSSHPLLRRALHLQQQPKQRHTRHFLPEVSPPQREEFPLVAGVFLALISAQNPIAHRLHLKADCGVNSAIIGQIMQTKISANEAVIGSDNALSPALRQSILLTNAVLLEIGPYFKRYLVIKKKSQKNRLSLVHIMACRPNGPSLGIGL